MIMILSIAGTSSVPAPSCGAFQHRSNRQYEKEDQSQQTHTCLWTYYVGSYYETVM